MLHRHLPVRAAAFSALVGIAAIMAGCLPLPVHTAPAVSGRVVDAATGEPLAGAVVVLRYDVRHSEVLPDRDLLGHVEVSTGADGAFEAPRYVSPGLSIVPLQRTEARVAGVMASGYRCPKPLHVSASEPARLALVRAIDREDRRSSCRPLAAKPDEAPRYLAFWRDLYPREQTPEHAERQNQVDRLLAAREVFGFGENCEGPVLDLALAPGGRRAAFLARQGGEHRVAIVGLDAQAGFRWVALRSQDVAGRRLAWTTPGEAVLWEPAAAVDLTSPASVSGVAAAATEVVWRDEAAPAARDAGSRPDAVPPGPPSLRPSLRPTGRPLELADLQDEGDARSRGRTFQLSRTLDPASGLPVDWLEVRTPNGDVRVHELPGETCGPRGQFGLPHYRIAADGHTALDLRYVDGGCRPVAIDLRSGASRRLDRMTAVATCREHRRMPASQLTAAVRGYAGEVDAILERAGADLSAAYTLHLAHDGGAEVISRDYQGGQVRVPLPAFPVATPLRRIEISVVGASGAPGSRIVPGLQPL